MRKKGDAAMDTAIFLRKIERKTKNRKLTEADRFEMRLLIAKNSYDNVFRMSQKTTQGLIKMIRKSTDAEWLKR